MQNNQKEERTSNASATNKSASPSAPTISLTKGGGAIRGIGEKFTPNPFTGTASFSVPIYTSPERSDFHPELTLNYSSGAGNGPFGMGWSLSVPCITRKTEKGLPQYRDAEELDTFILSGAEDLVPVLENENGSWKTVEFDFDEFRVKRYRPRVAGLFARIERLTNKTSGEICWRSISKNNITSIYGRSKSARIADPEDDKRIFSWLLEETSDEKGNVIRYEYKGEDLAGVSNEIYEAHRLSGLSKPTNTYPKRIKYGNHKPPPHENDGWYFEVVFDYGEHDKDKPEPETYVREWKVRKDAFSSYRSGFEIRTYRCCERILMFHHFPVELGTDPYLVRSTDITYKKYRDTEEYRECIASFINSITQTGYIRNNDGSYQKRSFPPLELEYTGAEIKQEIQEIDQESLESLPQGVDGVNYRFIDLDAEGISGIFTEQGRGWFYKRGMGDAKFGPATIVKRNPSVAALSSGTQQLLDLDGNGYKSLVEFSNPLPGYFERIPDEDWADFMPFESVPNIDWRDRNLQFIDINGDGFADILITEDDRFIWYPSKAKRGFSEPLTFMRPNDEAKGPAIVFSDSTQTIHLADMSGDGLTDIVRICNGEVCYWPNMGYGRFGPQVNMGNAPSFARQEQFRSDRIRLGDIDGSGTTDIIYLGEDQITISCNQAGNSLSDAVPLDRVPPVDNHTSVQVVDLLGNGTACLVWSSPLPTAKPHHVKYIDLMGGVKPHLLTIVRNNLGVETRVKYAPSTKFYLEDRAVGTPWVTKLPFPVHVIEKTEVYDYASHTKFVSRYKYHHGYFDGHEREFRGFGKVEQWDTETFPKYSGSGLFTEIPKTAGEEFHLPPVRTVTWFHTGAYLMRHKISRQFEDEYYAGDSGAKLLPDTMLPADLSSQEIREACRALKGSILRQEIYAEDESPKETFPYSVSERDYLIKRLQPIGVNRHSVFYVHACETIDYHYERSDPPDPRIAHQIVLDVDDYGNLLKTVAIGYGRRETLPYVDENGHHQTIANLALAELDAIDKTTQTKTLITYTEYRVTNKPNELNWYHIGVPIETRTYELTGFQPSSGAYFSLEDFIKPDQVEIELNYDNELAYEALITGGRERRLIEHLRSLYRKNDLTGPLSLGEVHSLALPYESYKLAFTPGLVSEVYQTRATDALLESVGRYVHSEGDNNWWIPSGKIYYSLKEEDDSVQELAYAQNHFYLPHRFQDAFGNTTTVKYDDYDLLVTDTHDPVQNFVEAKNHYRTLAPQLITDTNRNKSAVRFDELGMAVMTFLMGALGEGDRFDETSNEISSNDDPTTKLGYDLFAYMNDPQHQQPIYVHTCAREQHGPANLRWQESRTYSDGFGRETVKKIQAEPGKAKTLDAGGNIIEVDTSPNARWVGTGHTVFNNKGNPVKKYEPFFSVTPDYEMEEKLVIVGVTPIFRYDPMSRLIYTDLPNGTFSRVEFDAWKQTTWDENDTVLESQWYADRGSPGPTNAEPNDQEKRAAWLAAKHAKTPTVVYLDSLGRTFLTVMDNGVTNEGPQKYKTRIELDIEGNQRSVTDALERKIMIYKYDMLGTVIHQSSMEAGARWMLNNVSGNPIRDWNSRKYTFKTQYDSLQRPTHKYVQKEGNTEILVERIIYGENHPEDNRYLRGQVYQHYDSAGVVTNERFDFKGNLLESSRKLAKNYKQTLDWFVLKNETSLNTIANLATFMLEPEKFTSKTKYDALNRPIQIVTSHGGSTKPNIIQPVYNEANLLDRIDVWMRQNAVPNNLLDPATTEHHIVTDIDYNAKGQRTLIKYGNKVQTLYDYDEKTFCLKNLTTKRMGATFSSHDRFVQDLSYMYDPVRSITYIQDDADLHNVVYFKNQRIEPNKSYEYDPIYRLIKASGREHLGQDNGNLNPPQQITHDDSFQTRLNHPGDGNAMGRYTEEYIYDAVGNILSMHHKSNAMTNGSWTRYYAYDEGSLLEPSKKSNRLSSTSMPGDDPLDPYSAKYSYVDEHGNDINGCITSIPHLTLMNWDYKEQLQATSKQQVNEPECNPETTYYVYDASGQRIRKVTECYAQASQETKRKKERLYLGGFEIYREYKNDGQTKKLERECLHVMDDQQRIALIETKTIDIYDNQSIGEPLTRYQYNNHLGSSCLELDKDAAVITYEEYYPYGCTSYQAVNKEIKAAAKRYRYNGKERNEENGFCYYGARSYAPWLGRWTSVDPAGTSGGIKSYNALDRYGFDGLERDDEIKNVGNNYHTKTRLFGTRIGRWWNVDPLYTEMDGLREVEINRILVNPQLINLYLYVGNNPVNWIDPIGLQKAKLKPPWTEMQLKTRLWSDLLSLRSEYDRAPWLGNRRTAIRKSPGGEIEEAKGRYVTGMAFLRELEKGVRPPPGSVAWRAYPSGGKGYSEEGLDQLFEAVNDLMEKHYRDLADAVGGPNELNRRIQEIAKKDPYFKAFLEPDPADTKVAEEYEKAFFGTPTVIGCEEGLCGRLIGRIKIKENLPEPDDIKVPEELKQYLRGK